MLDQARDTGADLGGIADEGDHGLPVSADRTAEGAPATASRSDAVAADHGSLDRSTGRPYA